LSQGWRLCIGNYRRSHHPYRGEADVLFWPASNHQSLCAACHGRKTTTTDPVTKQQRKAGKFREQEEAARHRTDWIYEANND
jgi:5-methylcytosine-specific restriction protein A